MSDPGAYTERTDIPSPTEPAEGAAQQVAREDLYEQVWREPMLRVALRHVT